MSSQLFKISGAVIVAAMLSACGGGGGVDAAVSTASFPIATAFQNLITKPQSANLSGSLQGHVLSLAVTRTPVADAVFEGATRKAVQGVITTRVDGVVFSTSSYTSYYDLNPLRAVGVINTNGLYSVINQSASIPASATVGVQGVGWNETTYTSSSKTSIDSTTITTWSLEADTASTAWLCGNSVVKPTYGSQSSGSECYKINTSGDILGMKATLVTQGQSVTFQ